MYFSLLLTVAQFMHVLRQRIQLGATESIFLMVNGITPTTRYVCNLIPRLSQPVAKILLVVLILMLVSRNFYIESYTIEGPIKLDVH